MPVKQRLLRDTTGPPPPARARFTGDFFSVSLINEMIAKLSESFQNVSKSLLNNMRQCSTFHDDIEASASFARKLKIVRK